MICCRTQHSQPQLKLSTFHVALCLPSSAVLNLCFHSTAKVALPDITVAAMLVHAHPQWKAVNLSLTALTKQRALRGGDMLCKPCYAPQGVVFLSQMPTLDASFVAQWVIYCCHIKNGDPSSQDCFQFLLRTARVKVCGAFVSPCYKSHVLVNVATVFNTRTNPYRPVGDVTW